MPLMGNLAAMGSMMMLTLVVAFVAMVMPVSAIRQLPVRLGMVMGTDEEMMMMPAGAEMHMVPWKENLATEADHGCQSQRPGQSYEPISADAGGIHL